MCHRCKVDSYNRFMLRTQRFYQATKDGTSSTYTSGSHVTVCTDGSARAASTRNSSSDLPNFAVADSAARDLNIIPEESTDSPAVLPNALMESQFTASNTSPIQQPLPPLEAATTHQPPSDKTSDQQPSIRSASESHPEAEGTAGLIDHPVDSQTAHSADLKIMIHRHSTRKHHCEIAKISFGEPA